MADLKKEFKKLTHVAEQIYDIGYEARTFDRSCEIQKAYERGLNDAWECARKIVLWPEDGGFDHITLREIFGEYNYEIPKILRDHSASGAIAKIKEYEEKRAGR